MFYKIRCPACNGENPAKALRSSYSVVCSRCGEKFYVSVKSVYWIELLAFIPVYWIVSVAGDVIYRELFGIQATYWNIFPFIIFVAFIFHGFVVTRFTGTIGTIGDRPNAVKLSAGCIIESPCKHDIE
jgi:hypothetical protein